MLSVQHQSLNLTLHQVGYSKHNRPAEVITLCWMSGVGSVVFVMIHLRCMYHCFHSFRDAVETCSALKSADEKEQCFLNFGLDSHAVEQYYEPVMKMEEAVQERSNGDDILAQEMTKVGGLLLILMFGVRLI